MASPPPPCPARPYPRGSDSHVLINSAVSFTGSTCSSVNRASLAADGWVTFASASLDDAILSFTGAAEHVSMLLSCLRLVRNLCADNPLAQAQCSSLPIMASIFRVIGKCAEHTRARRAEEMKCSSGDSKESSSVIVVSEQGASKTDEIERYVVALGQHWASSKERLARHGQILLDRECGLFAAQWRGSTCQHKVVES